MMQRSDPYYFNYQRERAKKLQVALFVLIFGGILVGVFGSICMWLEKQSVQYPDPVCDRCGFVLDGTTHNCEDER